MQPQLKSKVRCTDREIGEVTKVIVDPLSREISHIVVSMNGSGERQVSMALVQTITDDAVQLRNASSEVAALPPFKRDEYLSTHEVEIAHLEDNLHVTPGEVLVPFPELEKNVKRRTFFMNFTHAIGFLIDVGGVRIWNVADTEYDARLRSMRDEQIDVALIPINGVGGNLNAAEAAFLLWHVQPKIAVPNHYNMWYPAFFGPGATLDPREFIAMAERLGATYETRVLDVGEIATFGG